MTRARSQPVLHFTAAERVARGRAARSEAPRSSHSALEVPPQRDPIALLQAQEKTRVAELLPIRHGRMLSSPLAFFRGAAAVMANDLAPTPRAGLHVQLCGDAHLLNFGGFASPERNLVFDVNDFDETLPGPFEWDVKRLAASVEVAGRDRGFADTDCRVAVLASVRSYREQIRKLAAMHNLDVWYSHVEVESLVAELRQQHETGEVKSVEEAAAKARAADNVHALAKLTRVVDGEPRIVSDPPLIVPIAELADDGAKLEVQLRTLFRSYRRSLKPDRRELLESFSYGDLARKVVGIGSVGTRCWIFLLLGRDESDPLFLQVKEAQASVLEPFLGSSVYANHAQRVVEGQRLSQAVSDILLGWIHGAELDAVPRDFYVRQLRDWKVSIDVERIKPPGLAIYAQLCGATLARAHARSGDRIAIGAYLGKGDVFDRAVAAFAAEYADLNEQDHAALAHAVQDGRIKATEGV